MDQYVAAQTIVEKLDEDIGVLSHESMGLKFAASIQPFRNQVELAQLDSINKDTFSKDFQWPVSLPANSTRRDFLNMIYHQFQLETKTVYKAANAEHAEALRPLTALEFFTDQCNNSLASQTNTKNAM